MQIIFTFTFNTETQEAAIAGNVGVQQALQLLQQLAIADAVNKAKLDKDSKDATMTDTPEKEKGGDNG